MNVLRGNLLPLVISQKIIKTQIYIRSFLFILKTKRCVGTHSVATPILEE